MALLLALTWGGRASAEVSAQQLPPPSWSACGGSFDCATLSVPLDYEQPGGRQIDLALIRQTARDPARRLGVMLTNPGGPGGSGIDFTRSWARALAPELQDRFDIVGFDPRGVGRSTPLLCHDDIKRIAALDPAPPDRATWEQVHEVTRAFAQLCGARGGDLLAHLGSLDVVRDMERLRQALREDKITYVGYSYGTVLGALYADRFPDRVRAMVLDGPVDLAASADDAAHAQAVGFEGVLNRFIDDCRTTSCPLASGGRDPGAAIDELMARARAQPIRSASADRPAGPGEAMLGIVETLYSRRGWPGLARAVQSGLDGDGSTLVRLADRYLGRIGGDYDNSYEMNLAVNCLDEAFSRDPAHYEQLARRFAVDAPRFGAALGSGGLACAYWPVPAQPLSPVRAAGAPPLLVIGTTNDPATPFAWALATRRALASAVLLAHEGDGHTIYATGSRCVDDVTNRYLLTLALPGDGAVCGSDAAPLPALTPPGAAPAVASARTPAASTPMPLPAAPAPASRFDRRVAIAVALPIVAAVLLVLVAPRARRSRR